MIKFFLALFLAFHAPATIKVDPDPVAPNVVAVEDDNLTGISLPPYGRLCEDVGVRGDPRLESPVLYTLHKGEVVELREQPTVEPRDWVMIAPAEWIPLSAVCE